MGTRAFLPVGKAAGTEADHVLPASAEVKNEWSYTCTPHLPSWCAHGQLLTVTLFAHIKQKKKSEAVVYISANSMKEKPHNDYLSFSLPSAR
jgi:hypothetical protein